MAQVFEIGIDGGDLLVSPEDRLTDEVCDFVRANKPALVAAGGKSVLIFGAEAGSTAAIERWNVHAPDGPLSVWYVDGATREQVEVDYPTATAIEPWVESVDVPFATLPPCEADTCEAFEERAAIMEFDAGLPRVEAERLAREQTCKACEHFARPGKSDGYCGAEVLRDVLEPAYGAGHPLRKLPDDHGAACMAFSGANAYGLDHPVTRLETGGDDRRTCRQCGNLSKMRGDVCTIAIPGGLVSARKGYQPMPDVLQRCAGYAPGADDQDQRTGVERWPGLAST